MSAIAAIFDNERSANAARDILADAGYPSVVIKASHDPFDPPVELKHRGELMLRGAVKWGVIGALAVEIPSLIVLLFLPVDVNVKVFMAATMWKFGAGFGAWLGAAFTSDRGLDAERAEDYESELARGRRILAVNVRNRDRLFARGALVESDALEVRDINGTFELRVPLTGVYG
jgi:hypothetical protein